MANIRKIKIKPEVTTIKLTRVSGKQDEDVVIRSYEKPHPDLINAMNDAIKVAYDVLQLPLDWMTGGMSMSSVSFGASAAAMTVQVKIPNLKAPLTISTPEILVEKLPEKHKRRLALIEEEAASFLNGKTAQLTLPHTDKTLTHKALSHNGGLDR